MVFNASIQYRDGALRMDDVSVESIADAVGTPVYIYSLKRIRENLWGLRRAFASTDAHIHYSAKANSNSAVLRAVSEAGAGIDAVSGGEIQRALTAGARAEDIVFAGVGKTRDEIDYAVKSGVGWINVENPLELKYINAAAESLRMGVVKAALRFNPQVEANTHRYMSTGHGAAKFGMTADAIDRILGDSHRFPRVKIAGLHMHIGSQLGDTAATREALRKLLDLAKRHSGIDTINLGGGMPVTYRFDESVPKTKDFAAGIAGLLRGYRVLLEPGRAIVADAGILVVTALYVKRQAGRLFYIVDGSMAELIRPALYQAHHEIVPLAESHGDACIAQVVGPVCESADVLAWERELPRLDVGDRLAIMTTGAYGMAMASNYNSRLRPAEVVVEESGGSWRVSRRRETLEDLIQFEA